MLESIYFTFNGINSKDMGVCIVNSVSGLYSDIFLSSRNVIESRTPYKSASNFLRVDREPVSISLSLYFEKWQTTNNMRQVIKWLDTDKYVPFFTDSDPERIMYGIIEGTSDLLHNGAKQGYANVTMKLLYPFALSPDYTHRGTVRSNAPVQLILDNFGDATIRPYIKITKIGNGNISIKNEHNNQTLQVVNLYNNEVVDIDCSNELIRSSFEDISNRYLYGNHNEVWLDFPVSPFGGTVFTFTGDFSFEFTYNMVYKHETR